MRQNQLLIPKAQTIGASDFQYFDMSAWDSALELSDHPSTEVIRDGDRTIVVIDNVLRNPYHFREMLINGAPAIDCRWHPQDYSPGHRQAYDYRLFYPIHNLAKAAYQKTYLLAALGFKVNFEVQWGKSFTNIYQKNMQVPVLSTQPHCDGFNFVWSLWLTDEQDAGGTSFWSYKNERYFENLEDCEKEKFKQRVEALKDAENLTHYTNPKPTTAWKMEYLSEMKFNRLLIYPGRSFHAPHLPPGCFEKTIRYALVSMGDSRMTSGY